MATIHPTSFVSKECVLADGVEVGPYCILRGQVRVGKNTILRNNVIIGCDEGVVEIGEDNIIFSGAVLGEMPQDKKYKGEKTKLTIGNANQIREYVTLNLGTITGGGETRIGNKNLIMAYVHFGHDCIMGDSNVIANGCQLAGHVTIENHVTLGGMSAANQFARMGSYSFIAGMSGVNRDILPYAIAQGNYAVARATNKIGLERNGFSDEKINEINKAIRILTKDESTMEEKLSRIKKECQPIAEIEYLIQYIKKSERGVAL